MSSPNSFGNAYSFITFGESHGAFIGVVIDGIKPNIPIDADTIQHDLNRRKPGQSSVTTPRNEPDQAQIVSGIYDGKTTGTPICILIKNQDQRSKDYGDIAEILRPGHASHTYLQKYGVFDYRGGGRASGRETALRVAAGSVAKQILAQKGVKIIGFTRQVGDVRSDVSPDTVNVATIESNIVRAPDAASAEKMIAVIHAAQADGDSIGGVVEVVVKGCPTGLGEPIYHKLDADLAHALMTLGAVKGFEIGNGFESVRLRGSQNNDPYYKDEHGNFRTTTNKAGGVVGGISNGEDIIVRIAVKPASSITKPVKTANRNGDMVDFKVEGRHDPCICPRVVPVAEAMVALVLLDHIMLQDRIAPASDQERVRQKLAVLDAEMELLSMQRKLYEEELANLSKTPVEA
ncbi:MAG: chorismate synthase [Candidatus Kapabacteria bacterium]|nr:chorismate synthase [Candidatus Kapabacteria bacterium]